MKKFPGIKKVSIKEDKNQSSASFSKKIRDTARVTMSIPFSELLGDKGAANDDKPDEMKLPEKQGYKEYFEIANEQLKLNRSRCAAKAANRGMKEADVDAHEACILWTDIGNGMYDVSETEGAIEAFSSAYKLNDKVLPTIFNLGVAHQVKGNFAEAEKFYKKAHTIDPDRGEVWSNMGVVHFYREDLEKAEAATRKSLKINPKSHFAWDNLACLLAMKGNLVEALDACFEAIDLQDDFKQSWFKIGMIYFEQKNLDLAENAFNKAKGLAGLDAMIYYHQGHISLQKDNILSACYVFEKAMKIDKTCEMGPEAWTKLKEKALQQNNTVMSQQAELNEMRLRKAIMGVSADDGSESQLAIAS